jgi:hypothetical protein
MRGNAAEVFYDLTIGVESINQCMYVSGTSYTYLNFVNRNIYMCMRFGREMAALIHFQESSSWYLKRKNVW